MPPNADDRKSRDKNSGVLAGVGKVSLRSLVPLLATAAMLALLFVFVDFDQMLSVIRGADIRFLPFVALLASGMLAFTVIRLDLIVRQLAGRRLGYWFMLRLNFFTGIMAYAVPVGAMADGVRAAVLWAEAGLGPRQAVEISLQDRIVAVLGFVALGSVLVLFQPVNESNASALRQAQAVLYWGGVAAFVFGVMAMSALKHRFPESWLDKAHGFVWRLLGNVLQIRYLVPQVALTSVSLAIFTAMIWLSLAAMGIDGITFWAAMSIVPSLAIAQNIPFFYLGWGAREFAAVVLMTTILGIDASQAVAVSLFVGVGMFFGALPGVLFAPRFLRFRRAT
tara:strand:- start:127077 stop:128087 length:1011 start_codon:yes stop_codon:yes gene_type:complete